MADPDQDAIDDPSAAVASSSRINGDVSSAIASKSPASRYVCATQV
jgi:hypothetical protein